jgi:hypothetical protein
MGLAVLKSNIFVALKKSNFPLRRDLPFLCLIINRDFSDVIICPQLANYKQNGNQGTRLLLLDQIRILQFTASHFAFVETKKLYYNQTFFKLKDFI